MNTKAKNSVGANNSNTSPKWFINAQNVIETLSAKDERTAFDSVRLANQLFKIENRSLSKVYNELKNSSGDIAKAVSEVLGKSSFPTFKAFKNEAKPGQQFFSIYAGLMMLKKFNKSAKQVARAKRQSRAQADKIA